MRARLAKWGFRTVKHKNYNKQEKLISKSLQPYSSFSYFFHKLNLPFYGFESWNSSILDISHYLCQSDGQQSNPMKALIYLFEVSKPKYFKLIYNIQAVHKYKSVSYLLEMLKTCYMSKHYLCIILKAKFTKST